MEQNLQSMTTQKPTSGGTFTLKIKNTTYVVGVHFNQTAKDTLEDKMKRLMMDEMKLSAFKD